MKLDCGISLQHEVGWDRHTLTTVRYLAEVQTQPFLVYCENVVTRQLKIWSNLIARVKPVHDVSLNSLAGVVESLQRKGVRLDITCKQHLQLFAQNKIHFKGDEVVYSAPHKMGSHIKAAHAAGITDLAFSSEHELNKIKKNAPNARLNLHLDCSEPPNLVEVRQVLAAAHDSGLPVVGLHLDLAPATPSAWFNWLRLARSVVDLAASIGIKIVSVYVGDLSRLLADHVALSNGDCDQNDGAQNLASMLDQVFPPSSGIRLAAGGGRFLVGPAITLAARVIAVREKKSGSNDIGDGKFGDEDDLNYHYYVNEGVFGAFSGCLWEENNDMLPALNNNVFNSNPLPLGGGRGGAKNRSRNSAKGEMYTSAIFGPSGDELDLVMQDLLLPRLVEDDWLLFPGLGIGLSADGFELRRALGNGAHIFGKPEQQQPTSKSTDGVKHGLLTVGLDGSTMLACSYTVDLDTFHRVRFAANNNNNESNNNANAGEDAVEDDEEAGWQQLDLPLTNIFLSED